MSAPTNRLIREKSPYLLQHARNPVDWYPWGEAAFSTARSENKPIFLSVGYSTCHWCHVMERESFENEAVAELMNRHFVNIKVDREERPDVDRVYMAFVQATTGQGGWPMSVWLTPDLKPFAGGTYFPPEDNYGRSGFKAVLKGIAQAWEQKQDSILEQSRRVAEYLSQAGETSAIAETDLKENWIADGARSLLSSFDSRHGGFGGAPKFPRPVLLNFLFRAGMRLGLHHEEGRRAVEAALFTLRQMAGGGMRDHVGGGFHRYSVDAFWHVPHFEKMLYDQAQLALSYLDGFQITRDSKLADVARGILGYVARDLRNPNGGFYSAEDADSLPEPGAREKCEGAFYVWTAGELKEALGGELFELFAAAYGVEEAGNCAPASDPHGELRGKNVLIRRKDDAALASGSGLSVEQVSEKLKGALKILFERRARRPRPHLDDKVITAWNGLMISAYARAAALGESEWLEHARQAAAFLRENLTVSKQPVELLRSWREGAGDIRGFADDYAFLIQGLLDLYEAGGGIEWLQWAEQLQLRQDELFWDPAAGCYDSSRKGDPHLIARMKEDHDGAEPAANSISIPNLLRLEAMTGRRDFRDRAGRILSVYGERMASAPAALPQMLSGLDLYLSKPVQVVLAGSAAQVRVFAGVLREKFRPALVLLYADGGDGQAWLAEKLPHLRGIQAGAEGRPAAHVCRDYACQLPVYDVKDLLDLLKDAG
ncbi:MAG: thioredoxin domain-containing protein [Methylacidiphilales bacterium]|nr:thioredoxin domain-containing protein [Candidatus Methylacidiphilales bacterium]